MKCSCKFNHSDRYFKKHACTNIFAVHHFENLDDMQEGMKYTSLGKSWIIIKLVRMKQRKLSYVQIHRDWYVGSFQLLFRGEFTNMHAKIFSSTAILKIGMIHKNKSQVNQGYITSKIIQLSFLRALISPLILMYVLCYAPMEWLWRQRKSIFCFYEVN